MSPLLRRRKNEQDDAAARLAELKAATVTDPTAKKGKPTPRRKDKEIGRIGPPAPPPMTRKEAYARTRERGKDERGKARAGVTTGEDRSAMARDRGPVRQLVRDVVDSRRGIGGWFFIIGLLIIFGNQSAQPQVRLAATILWAVLLIALAVDWTLMGRRVTRLIHERHPDDNVSMRKHIAYAMLRSMQIRRMRQPGPQVSKGQQL